MRDKILDAAEQEFSQNGYHKTLVSAIAREADVGKGSVYRYFEDKPDLFTSVVVRGFKQMRERIGTALQEENSFAEQIRRIQTQYMDMFEESRELVEIGLTEELPNDREFYERVSTERKKLFEKLAGWFQAGFDQNVFRDQFSAEVLAEFFHEFTCTELRRIILDDRPLSRRRFRSIRELFLNGVLVDREPAG